MDSEQSRQAEYYRNTVDSYVEEHVFAADEHSLALRILFAWLPIIQVRTILDVGAGTGRTQQLAAKLNVDCQILARISHMALLIDAIDR